MAETVKVWDARKGRWVEVAVDSNAARGVGYGVTVKPYNESPIDPNVYIPGSIQVTPGGPSISLSPGVQPGGSGRTGTGGTFDSQGNRVVSTLGMTSPGDPRGAYRKRDDVRSGDTGDTNDDVITQADLVAELAKIWNGGGGLGGGGGSGSGKKTISLATLKKALSSARKEIASAYDTASTGVQSAFANNPYAGLQAQEVVLDPGLSPLLQSQGVSSVPLEEMLASNREAASQRNAGMNDLYKMLAASYAQNANAQIGNVAAQRAATLDDLLQNYTTILNSGRVV